MTADKFEAKAKKSPIFEFLDWSKYQIIQVIIFSI
jgi:hypothetical protein